MPILSSKTNIEKLLYIQGEGSLGPCYGYRTEEDSGYIAFYMSGGNIIWMHKDDIKLSIENDTIIMLYYE